MKKVSKKKAVKAKPGPKVVSENPNHIGHNSGQVVPGLVKIVKELIHLGDQKKSIGKAERDLRNRAKSEFGVLSGPLAHEMRLRKMDQDVREQFESAHNDLKMALGYQTEMEFLKNGEEAQIKKAKAHAHQPGTLSEVPVSKLEEAEIVEVAEDAVEEEINEDFIDQGPAEEAAE